MTKAHLQPSRTWKGSLTVLLPCVLVPILSASLPAQTRNAVTQSTKGDQSPAVVAGGDVKITYGISEATLKKVLEQQGGNQKIVDRLLKTLDEKDVALAKRDATIEELSKKYEELEARLAKRPADDTLAAQARQRLFAGDLEGAEEFLQQSLEKNLQDAQQMEQQMVRKKKAAAGDAYELGSVKKVRLDYQGAKTYYEQAVQLDPEDSDYLNRLGDVLMRLGDPKKAIDYFTKALDIDRMRWGERFPSVAGDYYNLGFAWHLLSDYQKAIDYYTKALDIFTAADEKNHPMIGASIIIKLLKFNLDDAMKKAQPAESSGPANGH